MIKTIDDAHFEEYITSVSTPIIVDFWAEWCGPCKQLAPVLDEIDKSYGETIQIAKLNVDFNSDTSGKYDIKSIPALLFFKNGELLGKLSGAVPKQKILDKLEALKLL
jgi:thioredoxin 1|tara:strand:+ start:38 stop:361 length:324 start_codon:yes stop_codon:yes gene_type:complete